MQVGNTFLPDIVRPAQSTTKSAAVRTILEGTELSKSFLEAHRNTMEQQKARAKERLERAKQMLAMLKRMGFPPDVVARRAAELAREIGAAAQELASALGSAGSMDVGFDADAGISDRQVADAAQADHEPQGDDGPEEPRFSHVEKAYREIIGDRRQDGISSEDRKLLAEFEAVKRELKTLQEQAERQMRRDETDREASR